jgi:hypothetical protein
MIRCHIGIKGDKIAELIPGDEIIDSVETAVDLIAEASFNDCSRVIIHEVSLSPAFFDLKTRLAGEILQKFSNYRMSLAIVGDFSRFKSKSLQDFIRESNRGKLVCFTDSTDKLLTS